MARKEGPYFKEWKEEGRTEGCHRFTKQHIEKGRKGRERVGIETNLSNRKSCVNFGARPPKFQFQGLRKDSKGIVGVCYHESCGKRRKNGRGERERERETEGMGERKDGEKNKEKEGKKERRGLGTKHTQAEKEENRRKRKNGWDPGRTRKRKKRRK
jgi:hypothetical protein